MNISMVFGSVSRRAGGLFGAGRRLAQELHKLPETRVSAIGLTDEFTAADLNEWAPVPVFTRNVRGPTALGWSPGFQEVLRDDQPDLVHQHGIWTLSSLEISRYVRGSGTPHVISLHGMMDPWALRNSRFKKRLAWIAYQRRNLERAGALLVTSLREAEALRKLEIRTPIALIPNGTDPISKGGTAPWRGRIPSDRRVVLFLGRIHPKKGIRELLHGFAAFRQSHPELAQSWTLVVAGWDDGGHEAGYRALARELQLVEPSLLWAGPLFGPERDGALCAADAFILPSFSEGMPLAALEALSANTPVLLTDECNLPTVFGEHAGLRIEPNEASVAKGLHKLASLSEADRLEMSHRGEKLVLDSFTWRKVTEDTMAIYRWLLDLGEAPAHILV